MIFAAGLGTRMAPLTDTMPKALIPVRGRPLLGHVMDRLVSAGVTHLVVNTSKADDARQIADWLAANAPSGVDLDLSPEPNGPYDTGGGLAAAAHLFKGEGPILLHNVDILSALPLKRLIDEHGAARERLGVAYMAGLAVQTRASQRRILFDDAGMLGWGTDQARQPAGKVRDLAFAGVHVIEPAVLQWAAHMAETGKVFPIRDVYMKLVASGYIICPADVSQFEWFDVGTPEKLREAENRK